MPNRQPLRSTAALWAFAFVLLLAMHGPYLTLPYFWDELGQFVPQALDLYQEGRWIPVHTLPNVHPPGVEALLAIEWTLLRSPSIPAFSCSPSPHLASSDRSCSPSA
jgi:hypothetical protein